VAVVAAVVVVAVPIPVHLWESVPYYPPAAETEACSSL
jgi:hypothetical protein